MDRLNNAAHGRDTTRSILLVDDGAAARDVAAYNELAAVLEAQLRLDVRPCFTGDAQRGVRRQLQRAVDDGAGELVVLPLFRGSARQPLAELNSLLRWAHEHWPGLRCVRGAALWGEEHLLALFERRAEQAIANSSILREATALLLAVPGGDTAENAHWYGLARRLWERRGRGLVEPAFTGRAQPDLAAAIERAQALGARRIVVVPELLFGGPGLATLAARVAAAALERPGVELLLAEPLGRTAAVAAVAAQRYREALRAGPNGVVAPAVHSHGHTGSTPAAQSGLLPPRYRDGATVSGAPMAAAALVYGPDGRVAWDRIWGDFCDLALAGGPPHRGTLLEPVAPDEIRADPSGYAAVLDELGRGLRMVTGLDVLTEAAPGWIGLRCDDEGMARWLLRAIVVENVAVRREGAVLLLPAGPAFRLDGEIKNVVTVVAKTYRYWNEHRAAY